jgi:hypothetical protein
VVTLLLALAEPHGKMEDGNSQFVEEDQRSMLPKNLSKHIINPVVSDQLKNKIVQGDLPQETLITIVLCLFNVLLKRKSVVYTLCDFCNKSFCAKINRIGRFVLVNSSPATGQEFISTIHPCFEKSELWHENMNDAKKTDLIVFSIHSCLIL